MTQRLNDESASVDSMERYKVALYDGEDGYVVAECPQLPGCVSQGRTKVDAMRNIKEAISLYLEALKAQNVAMPHVEFVNVTIRA